MASLHKDPRGKSPFWYAAYTTATGKRMFKSTKRKVHREALEIALNLERAEREASTGRLNEARIRELLNDTLERVGGRSKQQANRYFDYVGRLVRRSCQEDEDLVQNARLR